MGLEAVRLRAQVWMNARQRASTATRALLLTGNQATFSGPAGS